MTHAFICDAIRTPFGRYGGALSGVRTDDLGAIPLKALMARAAVPTASRPDPHSRLMVPPGTPTGRPASSAAMRATLRLSSPAWLAQP